MGDLSRSQTLISKRNRLSKWFVSAARNVLHFLGIQNHSTDDEIWEQKILDRIQNKTLGLWSNGDSVDDASDELVQEVLSMMSEVLSEKVHISQESAASPSDDIEDTDPVFHSISDDSRMPNATKYDWNQSAKSINDIPHGPGENQQAGSNDAALDQANTIQESAGNFQGETVTQEPQDSKSPLEQGETDCPLNVDVEQSVQKDKVTIPKPDSEEQPDEGKPESSIGVPEVIKEKVSSFRLLMEKKEEGNVETSFPQQDQKVDPEKEESMSTQETAEKRPKLEENESKNIGSSSDLRYTPKDGHETTDSVEIITEIPKSVRFSTSIEQQDCPAMNEVHPGQLKQLDSLSGVKLRDALDLAGKEVQSQKTDNDKDSKPQANEVLNPGHLAYGKEAYRNYSLYVQIERKNKTRKLRQAKLQAMQKMEWRILKIDEIISSARDYYQSPSGRAARAWKDLRQTIKSNTNADLGSDTEIRFKLTKLHSHRPIFTEIIIFVQLLVFGLLCYFGGLTKIGFEPVLELSEGIPTFLGTETVHKWVKPNIWVGPNEKFWISVGALYSSCMREDYKLMLETNKKNYSSSAILGCCEVANKNTAGTLTQLECEQETGGVGVWKSGVPCGSRPTDQRSVSHNIKPCCINTRGECRMVSHQHCHFLEGVYHQQDNEEHCSQVNCIGDVCTGKLGFMLKKMSSKRDQPWLPDSPQQWWRLPLSVLYHYGIVHCLLVVGTQSFLLSQIEITIGWFRLMILYIVCGCGGLLAAVLFNPYQPHVGAAGALFGAVGLLFVELVHFWSIIKKPWLELLKLLFLMAVFIFSGTLPYLNIFTILTGLLLGMFCALGLLPYISIKRHKAVCRLVIVAISVPLVISLFFVMFYAFYKVQFLENCKFCKFINCYPYTENMCKLLD